MPIATLQTVAAPLRQWRARRLAQAAAHVEAWLLSEAEALPLWLPVGLGGGVAAWFILPGPPAWAGFITLMLGIALFSWLFGARARVIPRVVGVGAVALALGCALIWWRAERVAAPVLERPIVVAFSARIVGVEAMPARDTLRLLLTPRRDARLPPQLRVSMPWSIADSQRLRPGDAVTLRARLMPPPRAALPGGYDFARRAWFERIGAVGRTIGPVVRVDGGASHGASLRSRLTAHVRSRVDGAAGGIAAAFVTGDRGGIPLEDDEAMRRSGLAHLLSISGLHVTAAVGGAMWLSLRLLVLVPTLALRWPLTLVSAGIGAATGLGYTLLTGSEVPTVRSIIAALLVLLALVIGREALTLRLVAAGAIAVILFRPEAVAGPSFQLSFAAVTAIVALHTQPRIASWLTRRDEPAVWRLLRGFGGLVLTGIAVEIALMPIALFHFHKAGLYGSLANVVAIPLTTFIVMPAEALALALDPVGLGAPAWWVAEISLKAMLALAHMVAATPGAVAALPTMPVAAFASAICGGLWLLLWQSHVRIWGLLGVCVALGWAASVPAPDVLITGDGRHVASRLDDGRYALLRDRAGDFVRDQLSEAAGTEADMVSLVDQSATVCSRDFCRWSVRRDGRDWVILAARTRDRTDWLPLVRACAAADIVIADRWLPRGCTPRWFRADGQMLRRTGGLAISFTPARITSVNDGTRNRPWSDPPTVLPLQ